MQLLLCILGQPCVCLTEPFLRGPHLACFCCSRSQSIECILMCVASILLFLPPPSSVSHSSLLHPLLCTWCGSPSSIIQSSNHLISTPPLCSPPPSLLLSSSLHSSGCVTPSDCSDSAPPSSTCHCITVWLRALGCLPPLSRPRPSSSSPSSLGEGAYALGARRGNSPARRGNRGEILLVGRSAGLLRVCFRGLPGVKQTSKQNKP